MLAIVLLAAAGVLPLSRGQQSTSNITLFEAVAATPQLSLLGTVVEEAHLTSVLNSTILGNVTVFAPDNSAFNGTNGLIALLNASGTNLSAVTAAGKTTSILLYHIVTKPYTASQLTNGLSLETELKGYSLTVSINSTGSVVIVGGASNATVVTPNIQVGGSVVHIINAVLLPGALSTIPTQNTITGSSSAVSNQAISSTLLLGLVATATSVLLL
jgi:uncharacterized surface protein with fasciclin (FAS1) repeats